MLSPLRYSKFRNTWFGATLLSLGFLIQTIGAAWSMTELASSGSLVALVQTATMMPILILALPAGAIVDVYGSRWVGIAAVLVTLSGTGGLFGLSLFGHISATSLLCCCCLSGIGMALFNPVWWSSIPDQVPGDAIPPAVALNSISYNIARSIGPAVGGVIVATFGAVTAFGLSGLLYLPMIAILATTKQTRKAIDLPPEQLSRALVSGVRYIINSPAIRPILLRSFLFGLMGGSITGLLPLVSRDLLHANADTFGFLLGAYGVGAIVGAFAVNRVRDVLGPEGTVRISALTLCCGMSIIALSTMEWFTALALVLCGASWVLSSNTFNIGVQLPSPRWVAGRALATFQACIWGGTALGSWMWGFVSDATSVSSALLISGIGIVGVAVLGRWWVIPAADQAISPAINRPDPKVRIPVSGNSGPVAVEIEYRIRDGMAEAFYDSMQSVQLSRQRNGAYGWSLARDMEQPELWIERYHCPTWHDYLRQRNRATMAERLLDEQTKTFLAVQDGIRVRRLLERPFTIEI